MACKRSAQDVSHQLLYDLRMSNLHFASSETPHSVQIVIRKRFLKDKTGPKRISSNSYFQDQELQRLDHQNVLLQAENSDLKDRIEELEAHNKDSTETVKILEKKIAKIEVAALKSFEERKLEKRY